MFVVVIFHLFTCLQNLCCVCGGTKPESNTRKIWTGTHSHSLTHNKLESNISTKQLHVPTTKFIHDFGHKRLIMKDLFV